MKRCLVCGKPIKSESKRIEKHRVTCGYRRKKGLNCGESYSRIYEYIRRRGIKKWSKKKKAYMKTRYLNADWRNKK